MRVFVAVAVTLAGAGGLMSAALAQSGSSLAVPPPPPIMAAPPSAPADVQPAAPAPPGLVQTPVPPANSDTGAPPSDNAAGSTPSTNNAATTMPMSNNWVPGKTAEIGVLDRVDGGVANLNIPVGGQATSGDLTISVLACVMRPDSDIADAAIFVNVQSTANNAGPPIFHGWMVRSIPAATVVGDSSETLRVANCT